MTKILLPFLAILLSFLGDLEAQDPHFAQFYANRIYLNPAYAGFDPGNTVILNFRNQWPGIPDGDVVASNTSYRTFNATGDFRLPCFSGIQNFCMGLAGSFFHDAAGKAPLITQGGGLALSAAKRIIRPNKKKITYVDLRIGAQASGMRRRIDGDYFIYSSQLDPQFGLIGDPSILNLRSKIYSNLNTGLLINFGNNQHNFSGGVSMSNVLEPDYTFYNAPPGDILPRRYTGHLGATVERFNNFFLSPQLRADFQSKFDLGLFSGGTYIQSDKMYGGLFYQWNKNTFSQSTSGARLAENVSHIILSLGVDIQSIVDLGNVDYIQNRFVIGATFDYTVRGLSQSDTRGGFELAIKMFFDGGKKKNCLEEKRNQHRRCPIISH
jgi:type IX secretion system PorP/SprF family membrane protein